jgi:nucleotidyltransferase substrate binding protein (TIGR01987 family)
MNEETKIIFQQFDNALTKLEEVVALPLSPQKYEIDLTIHRFEFTIELFWKALKKKLADDYGINVNGPKPVLQQAYLNQLIDNEKIWLIMLEDRNLTSHTYKEALALVVYHNIQEYTPFLRKSLNKIIATA